jgi:hypothetical protein
VIGFQVVDHAALAAIIFAAPEADAIAESLKKNALSPRNRPEKANVFRGHSVSSSIDFQALSD